MSPACLLRSGVPTRFDPRPLLGVLLALAGASPATAAEPGPSFERQVAPLLQDRCLGCHSGPRPKGDLALPRRGGLPPGGAPGPAVPPGKAADSPLFPHVRDRRMPPKQPLGAADVEVLRRWIDAGAAWQGQDLQPASAAAAGRAGPDWWSL